MKLPHSLHRQLRRYATSYTAKITSTTNLGRSLSAEVPTPSQPFDTRGYPYPRRDLICKISQMLTSRTSSPLSDLKHYLQTLKTLETVVTLTPSEASLILKSLSSSPSLSIQFFRFCPSLFPGFRHDTFSYNRLLHILSINDPQSDVIHEVIGEMGKGGVKGNVWTVNILIGCLGGRGVERCFELAKNWDVRLNSYTYRCAMQAYLRSYEVKRAFEVYHKVIRRGGLKLDVFAYNMLLDGLAKTSQFDQAYMVFEDMKKKHCEPDQYTYTIMIRMTGKMNKGDESLALFHEMLGKGIAPNSMAYNTMIEALAKNRMAEKAIFLLRKMIENNCCPNEFTYSVILTALVVEGQLDKLDEIVKISKKFMTKSIIAYLVKTLSKLGHASETHRLFCHMWTFHEKGDRDACMSMLESFCNAGKTVEAIDLLDKIHEKGISTDAMMYNTVLSALGRLKQISHLHDLYEKMCRDGPLPDMYTYNILISSFGRAGKVDDAVRIFEQLEESDCKPDIVSYNSLINCLGKNGDIDEAHMRFREMQEKGLNPDVVTYSTLIECFGKTDRVEMASRLFDDMVAQGCSPNIVTYNILLDCFERSGKTAEAVDLYAKLKQQGMTPDSITYSILERLQSGSHRAVRVRKQNPITGWIVSPLR